MPQRLPFETASALPERYRDTETGDDTPLYRSSYGRPSRAAID
jgi:hypothetical protein